MIRARFQTNKTDYRPIKWPVKHPYWCTGSGGYSVVVAYADSEDELLTNWPEAENIESKETDHYFFSNRFPKPEWFKKQQECSGEETGD